MPWCSSPISRSGACAPSGATIKTRPFDSKTRVSEIALGCWQLGGDWGAVSDGTARQILRAAYASGVTLYDTADVYGGGLSEERIAAWRRADRPEGVFIATKLGRRAPFSESLTPAAMRAHTEDSLRRLQTDCLDLTQLHCVPTEALRRGEVFETLRELQTEGKIRRFGASVESVEEGLLCLEQPGLASLQIILNIFRQKPLERLLPRARAQGVAVLVRLPLASGLLSGKFTQESRFDPADHRSYNRDGAAFNVGETFAGLPFEEGVALADELKPLVSAGMTMAQWAQRWCLDQDGVTSLLTGASRPEQATENANVSALPPLSEAQREKLSAFYEKSVAGLLRGPN